MQIWLFAKRLKYEAFRGGCAFMWNGPEQHSTEGEISGDNGPLHLKIQLKCRIITFKCRYNVGIEEDTQGEERGGGCSLLLMLHISLLQLIMTRLLFDAGEPLFIFLWLQNSGHLNLAGNAKLWGCYPNCSSEFSAAGGSGRGKKKNVKKERKCEKWLPPCCFQVQLMFS